MKIQNCIKLNKSHKVHLLFGAIFVSTAVFANTFPERYNVIISRSPFGAIAQAPSVAEPSSELTPEQLQLQQELEKEAEALGKNIKLTAITTYQGKPAAGIIELNTKRTYYLNKGQSILGYTLTDIAENSILLETTNAIANITMSYAPGQPSEITIHPTSGRLSVLNIFEKTVVATNSVSVKQPGSNSVDIDKSVKKSGELELSDEVRKAVTIKDADGTERISFRELHRLRMEERNRKLEEERKAREEKAQAERKAKEEETNRQAELQRILEAEETLIEAEENATESIPENEMIDFSGDMEQINSFNEEAHEIPNEELLAP